MEENEKFTFYGHHYPAKKFSGLEVIFGEDVLHLM